MRGDQGSDILKILSIYDTLSALLEGSDSRLTLFEDEQSFKPGLRFNLKRSKIFMVLLQMT